MAPTDLPARNRRFLFLQGPHGPFFHGLGRALRRAGAKVWRVGFNAGDRAFWFLAPGYVPYRGTDADWPQRLRELIAEHGITDIVLYGDTRPRHAAAVVIARQRGLTVHVFEEGYLRPFWVTYERGGSNGNSRLMDLTMAEILARDDGEEAMPRSQPTGWGDLRQHVFYSAVYHWCVLFLNRAYPNFRTHRRRSIWAEARLYSRRLLLMPAHWLSRSLATARIRYGAFPYHVVLLQLDHDASFVDHSNYAQPEEFLREVLTGFARGAPAHHHLVLKSHPLDHGAGEQRRMIRSLAEELQIARRVHLVRGGKLAALLDPALSAVTVNSTAGQQVLWRGLPLMTCGRAVYDRPELTFKGDAERFFRTLPPPDIAAYQAFRRFMLATSQLTGGFYSMRARRRLLRQVVDRMLSPADPYASAIPDLGETGQTAQVLRLKR